MSKATEKKENTDAAIDVKSMNIFQRVAAITAELGIVAKNLKVEVSKKNSYKAVSERDILDAVKPLEEKYRVYSYPSDRKIIDDEILEGEKTDFNGNPVKTTTFFTRIQTTYTFVNIDNPTDIYSTIVFSEGIDTQDKGSGKAMTYADKYALMKAYKISTGDDPDQNASEENHYTRTGNRGGQGGYNGNQNGYGGNQYGSGNRGYQPTQQSPQTQQNAQGIKFQCKQCGKPITDAPLRDGTIMPASEVAFRSIQNYGVEYCASCQQKLIAIRNGQK